MPVKPGQIDWNGIPDASAPPTGNTNGGINWDEIPDVSKSATIQSRQGNSVENWLEDAQDDIRHGGEKTLPGRILYKMGATGTEQGSQAGAGGIIGGPLVGPLEAAHGAMETAAGSVTPNSEREIHGANELVRGIGHTAEPLMALSPELLPSLVSYGGIGKAAQAGASELGADPDEAELIGTGAGLAAGPAKAGLEPVGNFLQRNSSNIGDTASTLGGIAESIRSKNPYWLMTGHPKVGKLVGAAVDLTGRAASKVGSTPFLPHELIQNPFGASAETPIDQAPDNLVQPKQLGRGAIITPPPQDTTNPTSGVQRAVVRGPGGKMTTQYRFGAPGTESDQTVYGSQPPLIQTQFGEPQEPPQVDPRFAKESTTAQPLTEKENPDTINQQGKPLISTDLSRRDFLKRGAQTAAAGIASKIVPDSVSQVLTGESPSLIEPSTTEAPPVAEAASGTLDTQALAPKFGDLLSQGLKHYAKENGDDEDIGLGAEDIANTVKIQGTSEEGGNTLVHFTAAPDDDMGTADYLATVDPKGKIVRLATGFEEPSVMFDSGKWHFAGAGPELTPTEQEWGDKVSGFDAVPEEEAGSRLIPGSKAQQYSQLYDDLDKEYPEDLEHPDDSSDLIHTKGLQEQGRGSIEQGEQGAQDLAARRAYAGSKPGYKTQIPGENDDSIFPWAQHPYGRMR